MAKPWRTVGRGEETKILFYTTNASYKIEKKKKTYFDKYCPEVIFFSSVSMQFIVLGRRASSG